MTVTPYKDNNLGKKQQVTAMFNNIAPKYDFLNHFLSLGIDILWRKKAIRLLKKHQPAPRYILDIATGTGDFALEALALNPEKITGLDVSEGMLLVGREKIKRKNLQNKIELILGDSENLPFDEKTYDAITVGFGVRNFENLNKGLYEMYRVLSSGGMLVVLEFSKPVKFPVKQIYNLYFMQVLPLIGNLISKDNCAYTYLPESVNAFPDGKEFLDILEKNGFKETKCIPLFFGIASIYTGKK
ncbi:MAG: bifunctional demethylmenaquinone methyltransferase/2-methoxy-6-polyprenyl-1,4-benzoquinol methylase UbiE [Bacteroidetes bacterium]|nr:bifunctional demethylmenaquinone methyltransferase/2-methoxy-6-polyprenyl-1,4-benzoquinol methylase UbiE [Bacteroidota bacterium]HET6242995.1 bifunctional demethylmenaquinone methyltransferase/2-methoxy-6-polyprenyl-1,4-benzoquinol methylase UbiE [Bacteroidia bacterium]